MATVYFTAASLDGFIVDDHDSLDWLVTRDIDPDGPFGYRAFADSVGAVVMGAATYEWVLRNQPGEWMHEQPSWVLTHRPQIIAEAHPVRTFSGDVAELHPELVRAAGDKDVWVVGGGEVAAQFVAAGLVDDVIIGYAPCTLGAGAPVLPQRSEWTLVDSGVNGEFLCARWSRSAGS
ncbi:dihydrofolate reductase family protein [Mycolicibacterium thermoresistibile]|uniref:Deaminase-reductase domain-containing protein n=2 Tax=Mycolicibacterium thermoresistibile TaxID=1797 RepID=G7CDE4_MYCT3|nr:dihydrofolate reductase family protein [Mycolicibacterium thermoresistibile]EHI13968.1 deaminase-reductase domain-containing protein [Mycolicibacterium thermoresistibile ATCC 19527]MCV7187568.1 dihydrofolate reductase [Mycolicibacterium thermoresistibile]GAT17186.1 deaminase-reductase domain-containing protein [Mycolicibacterium thermoresistibile]SNW16435.1 bifunctional deaminase-reductase-like protein [Mycolicibacterium thermoresistibile]